MLTRTELDLQTEGITAHIYTKIYLLRLATLVKICDIVCLLIRRITHGPWISVTFRSLPECSVVFRLILRSSTLTNHFPSRTRLFRRLHLRSFRIRLKRVRLYPNPRLSSMFQSCDFAAYHLTLLRFVAG